MRTSTLEAKEFIRVIRELMVNDRIYEMNQYIQHGNTTTFSHCLIVAYYSYCLAIHLPWDYDRNSIIRGAMLHDFYLYDWHVPHPSHRLHGFVHPGFALRNAKTYYALNLVEEDIIEKHMWPMTVTKLPKYKETILVNFVDKLCSLAETFHLPIQSKEFLRLQRYFMKDIQA